MRLAEQSQVFRLVKVTVKIIKMSSGTRDKMIGKGKMVVDKFVAFTVGRLD